MPNPYYNVTGAPGQKASGSSAAIRAEFALVAAAFAKLPTFAGNANKPIGINGTEDGFAALSAFDSVAIGATTPSTGRFTTLASTGLATLASLTVTGALSATLTGNVNGNVTGNVTGNLTGNVTGNVSGSSGSCTGNAATATSATSAGTAGFATAANTANAVPWTGVSGRPTALSQFTNDSGFITAAGAAAAGGLTGTTLAANVTASSLTTLGTLSTLLVAGDTHINGVLYSGLQVNAQGGQAVAGMATASGNLGGAMVQGPGGATPAFMSFHRPSIFAAYFGIDVDNQWKVGGWTMGAAAYPILHSNNFTSYAPTLTGGGASGTWAISVSGTAASAGSASISGSTLNNPGRADGAAYPVLWAPNNGTGQQPTYSCDAVKIQSSTGRLIANDVVTVARLYGNGGGLGLGSITVSASAASGGAAGDIWFQY